jgi:ABC-type multidrug transport system permease subunit
MKKIINFRQLSALLATHTKELIREPAVLFWGIVFPVLMTIGLGLAFTQSGNMVRSIAIIQKGQADSSANSIDKFLQNKTVRNEDGTYTLKITDKKLGNTTFNFEKTTWDEAIVLLKRGEISLVLEDNPSGIEYNFDPSNSDSRLVYLNLSAIINKGSLNLPPDNSNVQLLTVKGTRYIDFFVPGLIAMGLLMSSTWGLGYNIIDKRSKKLLRRMIATPMRKSHFLISLITVRSLMNFIEAAVLFLFANLFFGIAIEGSLPALFVVLFAGNIGFAGISILISCRTANPEIGNGLINAVVTPMMVLSGIFFSYHNFPDWAIGFIKILPLTMLADATRSIFVEGAGFVQILIPVGVLLLVGIISFFIGLKKFKWH